MKKSADSTDAKKAKKMGATALADSTGVRVVNFFWIGIVITVADYLVYEALLFTIFQGNLEMTQVAGIISALIATILSHTRV